MDEETRTHRARDERSGEGVQQRGESPTVPPPEADGLNSALTRNITILEERRRRESRNASAQAKTAQSVTNFTGSMLFVYVHLAIVAAWVAINAGLVRGIPRFDDSFVFLATAASVEAIFLSTFVLISQNRAAADADRRAALDLQVNLLAEHEITRLIHLTSAIARKLEIFDADHPEINELKRDVAPETILDKIETTQAPRRT